MREELTLPAADPRETEIHVTEDKEAAQQQAEPKVRKARAKSPSFCSEVYIRVFCRESAQILQETKGNVDQMGVYTQKRRPMTPERKRRIKEKLKAIRRKRKAEEEQQANTENVSGTNEAGNGGKFEQEVDQGVSQQNDYLETNTSTKDEDVPVLATVQKKP